MENEKSTRRLEAVMEEKVVSKKRRKRNKGRNNDGNVSDATHPQPSRPAVEGSEKRGPSIDLPKKFSQMRLEAIFYPKFENEQKENQRIRQQMKERVLQGQGYLEVSIKHSGSLILWSGGERFYSKNSTSNVFTASAEILLRQHFVRAYWKENTGEQRFRECSRYVEVNRITLAFEVVTSFLGDHGDRPSKDFMILTAVAVKSASPYFMTTFELVKLAQQFRLPHNDAWIFSSHAAVESLFEIYDNGRETGLASTINPALSDAADVHISSLYPHEVFQGDIMEGIVIRYVPCPDHLAAALEQVKDLSKTSMEIRTSIVPPSLDSCPDLVANKSDEALTSPLLKSDLRKLHRETKSTDNSSFDRKVVEILEESESERKTSKADHFDITAIAESLKDSLDLETKRIARVISLLISLKDRVQYVLFQEKSIEKTRWLCIVHVIYDRTFPKYRKRKEDGMDLFRGFCIELVENATGGEDVDSPSVPISSIQREGEPLMLKMKFLPYMVRTFCCRNGLMKAKHGGPSEFSKYCQDLLSNWGISRQGRESWQPFLSAWGEYAHAVLSGRAVVSVDKKALHQGLEPLGALSSQTYLEHIAYFTQLYDDGIYSESIYQSVEFGSFRGVFIVVCSDTTSASSVADYVADQLGGAKRLDDTSALDKAFMERAISKGGGHVLSVSLIDDTGGISKVRRLLKEFRDDMALLLFDLVDNEIVKETKRAVGILKSWRSTQCGKVFTLSAESLVVKEDGSLVPDEKFQSMIKECKLTKSDDRPGILVFFPQIPGCGKSSLTNNDDQISIGVKRSDTVEQSRKLLVMAGDKTKGKYWIQVKQNRLRDTSSVVLADKNAPVSTWALIGQVCESTQAIAVPIIPDEDALQTTEIVGTKSVKGEDESNRKHVYPYSLAYLAVCMARVLERAEGSHAGNLDRGTKRACMIVLKFYSMYRHLSAELFRDKMKSLFNSEGALLSTSAIQIPFFRPGALGQGLPADLEETLVDGLKIQFACELGKTDTSKFKSEKLDELEKQLRMAILSHRNYLLALAADEEATKSKFVSQLKERVAACDEMISYDVTEQKFIKLASIDVDRTCVRNIFKSLQGEPELKEFFDTILGDRRIEDVFSGVDRRIVAKPHVTLAHFTDVSQAYLHETFDHLQGLNVSFSVVTLYWSLDNAALEVKVEQKTTSGENLPPPGNAFTHITVRVHDSSSASKSNQLPMLFESGQASKFDFPKPILLEGSLSLWK